MSIQDRASSAELAAEFERAMGSLAVWPLRDVSIADMAEDLQFLGAEADLQAVNERRELQETLTRIAAIALEGAARLRRGT